MTNTTLEQLKGYSGFSYLATPYSKYPGGLDEAARLAGAAAAVLMNRGFRVFSPIAHSHGISSAGALDKTDWEFWLDQDEQFIRAANGMIALKLDTWEISVGMADEIALFEFQGKPVVYLDPAEVGLVAPKRPSIEGMLRNPTMVI